MSRGDRIFDGYARQTRGGIVSDSIKAAKMLGRMKLPKRKKKKKKKPR